MLEIRNLTAGYPGRPVLENFSLDLPTGQVTAVIGPNGCGKSTLLKALTGILPASGTVTLDGRDLLALPQRQRAQVIACLPQSRPVPEITVRRLVLHGRFPYLSYPRHYGRADLAMAQAAIDRLGLTELADRSLPSLSGGQRQKAYIAMLLAQDTEAVLLDEPNTFLDIGHQLQLMELSRLLAGEGKTVVLVLHDLAMALEQADRIVVMEAGCCLVQGTAEQVFRSGALERAFGVEIRRVLTPDGWKYYAHGTPSPGKNRLEE